MTNQNVFAIPHTFHDPLLHLLFPVAPNCFCDFTLALQFPMALGSFH